MNVPYNKINTRDAAKMIGVDYATVAGWCKRNIINFTDLSNGSGKSRYMISENEVEYIKSLTKQHGVRKAMMYYDKNWNKKSENIGYERPKDDSYIFEIANNVAAEELIESTKNLSKGIDIDNLTRTILYIQDIKERLEDLEAEKNQLLNELEMLRKEVKEITDAL